MLRIRGDYLRPWGRAPDYWLRRLYWCFGSFFGEELVKLRTTVEIFVQWFDDLFACDGHVFADRCGSGCRDGRWVGLRFGGGLWCGLWCGRWFWGRFWCGHGRRWFDRDRWCGGRCFWCGRWFWSGGIRTGNDFLRRRNGWRVCFRAMELVDGVFQNGSICYIGRFFGRGSFGGYFYRVDSRFAFEVLYLFFYGFFFGFYAL